MSDEYDDEYDDEFDQGGGDQGGSMMATPQELQAKIDSLRGELRRMKEGDVIAKERDKLRIKLRDISEEHKKEVAEIQKHQGEYQETKRLVDVQAAPAVPLRRERRHQPELHRPRQPELWRQHV